VKEQTIYLYCDGACRGNQFSNNVGAWGYLLFFKNKFGEISKKFDMGVDNNTTNNRMELTSCVEALKSIKNKKYPSKVYIDSQYVISGMNEWLYNWMNNGWKNAKGRPIENQDLWNDLFLEKIKFMDIKFLKVLGHADSKGNYYADALCNVIMDNDIATMQILEAELGSENWEQNIL
jgi:ribonuclease HI